MQVGMQPASQPTRRRARRRRTNRTRRTPFTIPDSSVTPIVSPSLQAPVAPRPNEMGVQLRGTAPIGGAEAQAPAATRYHGPIGTRCRPVRCSVFLRGRPLGFQPPVDFLREPGIEDSTAFGPPLLSDFAAQVPHGNA